MLSLVLLSIGFSILVSFILSIGFVLISPAVSVAIFFASIGVQLLLFYPINKLLARKADIEEQKKIKELQQLAILEGKQFVLLECAHCGAENDVAVDLNMATNFMCSQCENKNMVTMQFNTSRTTDPIITDPYSNKNTVYNKMEKILEEESLLVEKEIADGIAEIPN